MAAFARASWSSCLANQTSCPPCNLPEQHSCFSKLQKTLPRRRKLTAWKLSSMARSVAIESGQPKQQLDALEVAEFRAETATAEADEMFDWDAQWYPVAVIQNLDKRVPTAVTIMGRDLVVWWDRNSGQWQVWDDKCPHRLAPLSEGRINEKGEIQCSYHGWCFAGCSGECTKIPQAPQDGPPVWKSERAYALVYPSLEQEGLLWFWPDISPEFKNIAERKGPPSVPVLADPTFKNDLHSRLLPYGYEQLIENLMDPAHVHFAHHGLQGFREKATPLNYEVTKVKKSGYVGDAERGPANFIAPCIFTIDIHIDGLKKDKRDSRRIVLVFICIPVSPGQSKVIWSFSKNFTFWIEPMIPRWFLHLQQMLVLDSDMYLLHMTERKLAETGSTPWQKACYVPTSSDAFVIAYRKWLNKYAGGGPKWGSRYSGLPPTPPKEQLMDRYWSHVKLCRHCSAAMQFFERAEMVLQALSVAIAAVLGLAALKPIPQLRKWSMPLVIVAILASLASQWLSKFVYKTYRFHDYNHALVK